MPMLDIKNLTLEMQSSDGAIKALDKVNLSVSSGEIRALVGESGSGKSLIVSAICGALPSQWNLTADRMSWNGENLLSMSVQQRREVMRREIAVVFQNPQASLDPSATLGEQLEERIPDEFVEGRVLATSTTPQKDRNKHRSQSRNKAPQALFKRFSSSNTG